MNHKILSLEMNIFEENGHIDSNKVKKAQRYSKLNPPLNKSLELLLKSVYENKKAIDLVNPICDTILGDWSLLEEGDKMDEKLNSFVNSLLSDYKYKAIYYFMQDEVNNVWIVLDDKDIFDIIDCTYKVEKFIKENDSLNLDYMIFNPEDAQGIKIQLDMMNVSAKEFSNGK